VNNCMHTYHRTNHPCNHFPRPCLCTISPLNYVLIRCSSSSWPTPAPPQHRPPCLQYHILTRTQSSGHRLSQSSSATHPVTASASHCHSMVLQCENQFRRYALTVWHYDKSDLSIDNMTIVPDFRFVTAIHKVKLATIVHRFSETDVQ
jgi:hypothetical protein